ncbi:MAG: ATPase [Bacteroidaceae bacterium]|nr:ATPase [Bacteroidaceae bacterium]
MKLIVDSGSTKTSWLLQRSGEESPFLVHTAGLNPVRDHDDTLQAVICEASTLLHLESRSKSPLRDIHFYGAGCIPPFSERIRLLLERTFPQATIHVESDLLGAARALCRNDEGIACILGTGSNSCLYDGKSIVQNVSPLGWILGDEGSGAVLGKHLVSDLLKGQLPIVLRQAFEQRFSLTQTDIIEAVYRQPQPNRFLASLVPFLTEHRGEDCIHDFLIKHFRAFFVRNVTTYQRYDLPVHFVGGIAYQFENELRDAAHSENYKVGHILRNPIESLAKFHSE